MKFQPDYLAGTNVVTRHDSGGIWVSGTCHRGSLLLPWTGDVRPWRPARVDDLAEIDFAALLELRPDVVIFGSGERLCFVSPALSRCLIERRIGIETMDTAAACRTFNVLVSEGRAAVAALLNPRGPPA